MENHNTNVTATEEQQEKTFTQEQVNAIVGKRLAEAKAANESAMSKREEELNQREMQIRAKELLSEKGLPKKLADVLKYSDEESLISAIEVIEHTRGFKDSPAEGEPKEDKKQRKILMDGIQLPRSQYGYDAGDPLRKAMGLK